MNLFLILVVLTSVCLWLYSQWSRVRGYWRERGVPYYPLHPHPILGSLTFLQRQNTAFFMRKVYKHFKSPYVGIWLFWRPALVINCPEISKRVLVKDSENFRDHFVSSGKTDPIGAMTLFLVKDPTWTVLRRRLTGVYTASKLRACSGIIQVKTQDLVQYIKHETDKNKYLHVRKTMTDYTTDIIGEASFGIVSETLKNGSGVFKDVTTEFMKFNVFRGLSWSSIFFFPQLVNIFRFSLFPKHTTARLWQICRQVIQKRGGFGKMMKDPKDLVDVLIKLKQESALEGEELSEDFLLSQASIFLLGGFDTTASTLSWIIYELAWHPQHQKAVYEEIQKAKQENGNKDLDHNSLSELIYLNCVIKETLRIFPPMGWLDRIAAKDYQIDENLTIPAGTPIYVNAVATQVDPKYFPDPMTFDPDRFLPENEKNIRPFTFLPFGAGPRICIGMRFAYHVIRYALATLICNFEIRALPNSPKPNEVRVESQGFFYMPVDDRMVVQFLPRE